MKTKYKKIPIKIIKDGITYNINSCPFCGEYSDMGAKDFFRTDTMFVGCKYCGKVYYQQIQCASIIGDYQEFSNVKMKPRHIPEIKEKIENETLVLKNDNSLTDEDKIFIYNHMLSCESYEIINHDVGKRCQYCPETIFLSNKTLTENDCGFVYCEKCNNIEKVIRTKDTDNVFSFEIHKLVLSEKKDIKKYSKDIVNLLLNKDDLTFNNLLDCYEMIESWEI